MEPRPPVFRGIDLTPEVLASQGRALRGLARSLLGDAHAAEDVEQETWLACLRRPDTVPVRLSAWLGTVARRLALRRKRGDERRHAREEHAAASEREVAVRGLEREEALRTVTQALLALDEPFKSALLLRYYEDRTPSAIAAELGLPLATVKSRLARGLEKLRARLGTEFGDEPRCARALLLLAGLRAPPAVPLAPASAAPSLATVGVLTMKLKLAGAVALLVLGSLFFLERARDPERASILAEEHGTATAAASLDPTPVPAGASVATSGAAREEAAREAAATGKDEAEPMATLPGQPAFLYRIAGQVRDARDLPLAGARVFLAPRLFPLNRVATTDPEGRFALEFEARRPTLDAVFSVDDGGGATLGLRELHLVAGRLLTIDVGLASEAQQVEGTLALSVAGFRDPSSPGLVQFRALARGSTLDGAPEARRTASGRLVFVDPPPRQSCARAAEESALVEIEPLLLSGEYSLALRVGEFVPMLGEFYAPPASTVEPQPAGVVRGTLRDANGAPLAGIDVGWGPPGQTLTEWKQSDEHGAFVLDGIPAGELQLRAGGGDHGRASERITLASGEERAWNPLLERGDEVSGRVRLANGDVFLGLRIELWSAGSDVLWCDSTATNEDGRFAFPNVPAGPLELHVYNSTAHPEIVFPVRVVGPLFGGDDVGDIVLTLDDMGGHALAVRLVDARGEAVHGAEVRLWHLASGRGALAHGPSEEQPYRLAGLPTGEYRVEAGSPLGWRALGTVFLEEDQDLGQERFVAPGLARVRIESARGETLLRSTLWSAHPDVFAQTDERAVVVGAGAGLELLLALRAGDYVLGARVEKGERREVPLSIPAGAARALTLRLEADGPRVEAQAAEALDALVPELEAELRAQSCAGCHAGPGG